MYARRLFSILLMVVAVSARAEVDFQREVRPILSGICFKCHGPDEATRKGGLRLDIREEALKPGKSDEIAIVPGNVEKSALVKRIFTTDEDDLMPPPKAKMPLTDAQKDVLKRWVAEGANYTPHWSFAPPKRPPLPEVKNTAWPRNEIDRFILARLEKEGLSPSEPADKYSLLRRVSLDLIGLPPTPEEADAFVNDTSENAYEKLVDRLLESPRYGERWARRWLDLARYADTNGYEKDRPRSIWAYRDWVINALNKDMAFDQFTVEQIAGDLLPNSTQDQLVATGFHRNTMLNEEGGADPLEYRFHAMVDRVHVTATTWLGLTMACAQCHTHKYDPIQQTDYYRFMALMNNADEPLLDLKQADVAEKQRRAQEKIEAMEAGLLDKFPAPSNIEWRVPGEAEFQSKEGSQGEFLKDGSFRVSGKNPDKDIYTITFEASIPKLTHLQIEALPDSEVGKGGPGRTDHGNFVVTEFEVEAQGQKLKFGSAEADFSQDGFSAEAAFDGKDNTGWAIAGPENLRQHRHAIFALKEPVAIETPTQITVRIGQQYGSKHTLGRFRVSLGQERFAGKSIAEKRQENLERNFGKWVEAEAPKAVKWQRLRPMKAEGDHPTLNVEADDAIFASGDFTKDDTYTLEFKNVPSGVKAIRIEALPDSRLPANGPGRVFYEGASGDFFLSNLKVGAGGNDLKIKSATQSFAAGGSTAEKAIDSDLQSGWSCNGGQGRRHSAVFNLSEAFPGGDLKVEMTMERYYASALGKFRISVTTEENAVASPLPEDAYEVLVSKREIAGEDKKILLKAFAQAAPQLASARKEIEDLRKDMPKFPTTLVMQERDPEHRRKTFRHHRGEFLQRKEEVAPGVPAFLPGLPSGAPTNRLGFAKWLVSKENPLTARVIMNRHWEAFFGRGLVRTMEDFGAQGEAPSNPALLDWLATEFMNRSWSQKQMQKLVVMSAAYQQSSKGTPESLKRDPNNVLVSRGSRFRVDAELVRDAALRASGLLTDKIGGPSVFPPQLQSITTEGAYGPLQWKVSDGSDRYRRSLYTFAKRTAPFAMTGTFDGPSGEACLARRDRSNTPLQALTLLNDEIFMDCAKALGRWAAAQTQDSSDIVEAVFRRCVTRPPTATEKNKLLKFYQIQLERFNKGELKAAEFIGADKGDRLNEQASWTALARVLLNLDETISKS